MPYDPNRKHKSLIDDRKDLDRRWNNWMKEAQSGSVIIQTLVVMMGQYNAIDGQLLKENTKGVWNAV